MLLLLLMTACGSRLVTEDCEGRFTTAGAYNCALKGFDNRDYDLVLPKGYDGSDAVPVVLALHGGGGSRVSQARTTCPNGKVDEPECLHSLADREGFAVVYPNGTGGGGVGANTRTWNAGGGEGDWRCTSGKACENGVDDVAYVGALLDDVASRIEVDTGRVYATGLSNGAAMSHRLGCELSERFAAIVTVGGGMQLTTSDKCEPTRPISVMHVHGTEDPCWKYGGGASDCPVGQRLRKHVSIERTMSEWAEILQCEGDPTVTDLPDSVEDGTSTRRHVWAGCTADLELLEIVGGGHAWPNGDAYLGERIIGEVPRDWGNEVIWDYMQRHSLGSAP